MVTVAREALLLGSVFIMRTRCFLVIFWELAKPPEELFTLPLRKGLQKLDRKVVLDCLWVQSFRIGNSPFGFVKNVVKSGSLGRLLESQTLLFEITLSRIQRS